MADYESRWFMEDRDLEPADGSIALDHYGWNVELRSASWRWPERRGENYLVPGRSGAVVNDIKPYAENIVPLQMWAQGAEVNGDIPAGSEAQKLVDHMDFLSKLFSYQGLRRLVRAQTTDYGRVNLIPNPSMENAGQLVLTQENIIDNPSAEYSEGDVIVRRNFADNPGMESSSADNDFRVNYIRNPRMAAEAEPVIQLTNLVKNPSVEAGTRYWRDQKNVKIMTSRKTRVGGSWPIQGQQSLRCVALAASATNASVEAHSIAVQPNTVYSLSGNVWQRTEGNMTMRMFVRWFNKNGTFISATSNVDVVVGADGTALMTQQNVTSPANAAKAAIRFVMLNAVQDDVFYVDAALLHTGATVKPYFDGDTDESDGTRLRWKDEPGRSESQQYYVPPRGWMSPTQTVRCTSDHARVGVQSAKVLVGATTATNDIVLRNNPQGAAAVEEETYVSGSIFVRRNTQDPDDTAATRTVKLRMQCWNSQGELLGTVLDAPGGSAHADITLTLIPNQWLEIQYEGGYTLADTEKVGFALLCGEAWSVDEIVYVDTACIEKAKKADDYFDGNTIDDDTFNYSWDTDAHWSPSLMRGAGIRGWTADQGRQFQSADGYLRQYAMQLQPYRSPDSTDRPQVTSQVLDLRPGRKHILFCYFKLSRSVSVKVGISYDNGETWTYGSATAPSAGAWFQASLATTVPVGSDPELTRIGFFYNAAPADGDTIQIDAFMLEPCQAIRKYFDGESGTRFGWMDEPERSVSVRYQDRANGWHGYGNSYPVVRRRKATGTQGVYVARAIANQDGELGVTFAQDGIDAELDYSFAIDLKPSVTQNGYVAIVWLDKEGTQVGISSSSTTSLTSASFTRKTVTASPPAGATVGVPIAVLTTALADQYLDADGARFGFGATTTYADGNTAGWKWSGTKGFSESEKWDPGVDYWNSVNGTFVRNGTWSTDRSNNGTYTVTNSATNCYFYAHANAKDDDRRFKLRVERDPYLTFRIDLRSVSVNAQVEVGFLLSKWTRQGWVPASVASLKSAKTSLTSGVDATKTYTVDTSTVSVGDATHFRPVVWLYNSSGGNAALSQVIRADKATVSRDDEVTYLDGTQQYTLWTGDADASPSKRVGPARSILVERMAAVEPESSMNAELARFVVVLQAPKVFWEDTIPLTQKLAIPRKGGVLEFDTFIDATAPMEDTVVTLNGPFNDIKITDVASGQWVRINERFGDDQYIEIDNGNWTVKRGNGKALWNVTTFSDGGVILPLSPDNDRDAPRLRVEADAIGRGAFIKVAGRRKFLIA